MPFATFSRPVRASIQTVWKLLLDKIENPGYYVSGNKESKILES